MGFTLKLLIEDLKLINKVNFNFIFINYFILLTPFESPPFPLTNSLCSSASLFFFANSLITENFFSSSGDKLY